MLRSQTESLLGLNSSLSVKPTEREQKCKLSLKLGRLLLCVFLKYWYKMNPAARGMTLMKWLGISHTFRKTAGAFEGCCLCGPKWDPAAILLSPWARQLREWHVQIFLWSYTMYGSCHASKRTKSTWKTSWKWSIHLVFCTMSLFEEQAEPKHLDLQT